MPEFTPGPWHVHDEDGYWFIYGHNDFQIHNTFNAGGNPEGRFMAEANRNLIAAAPELYEALEVLLGDCAAIGVEPFGAERARAALAKARGSTE